MPETSSVAFAPIGVPGLRQWNGYVDEERLRPLRGARRYTIYSEMATDPIIGASLLAMELLMRQVAWTIAPAEPSVEGQRAAEFVRGALFDDVGQTWHETLSEAFTCLTYGWSAHELVYKRRLGDNRDPMLSSRFDDGAIGWQGIESRAQDTLQRWIYVGGRLGGMEQRPWQGSGLLTIPGERLVLFHVRNRKSNPEGISFIRNCYEPWYYKKRVREFQAIGVERDLAGLPVMYLPPEILDPEHPAHAAQYDNWKNAVQGVRRNENEGLLLPAVFDDGGHRLYEFFLLTSGGARQFDTTAITQQYNTEMLIALFTDILMLGHEQTGSFALASSKTTLLATALGAVLASIVETFNRDIFPPLWRLNGFLMALMPRLQAGDIESVDLGELGGFIAQMAQSGLDVAQFEAEVWRRAGFHAEEG